MNIKRSNKWNASIVYCAKHMPKHVHNLIGGPFTETETDEPCPDCRSEEHYRMAPTKMRAALLDPNFSHTRFRNRFGGLVYAYHRDHTSPSGVMLKAVLGEKRFDKLYKKLLAEGKIKSSASPLSPTEGL